MAKSANPSTYTAVGNQITYTYVVKNTGNVGITGPITITDDHLNGGKAFEIQSTGLAVGRQITYNKATYTITQTDFDAGSVTNTASAAGTFKGKPVVSNKARATVTANKPSLCLLKSANPSIYSAVGNKIKYTYVVKNTGNVRINGPITITDDHLNGGKPFEIQSTGLAVGRQITYNKATYTITQTDFDAGSVTNKASAAGTFNGQPVVSNEAMATVTVEPKARKPSLSLAKSANPSTYSTVGNQITYTYIVKNIGNVGITGPITITDDHLNGGKPFEIQSTGLTVGSQITYNKATYTITQTDFDAGSVTNKASAAGTFNGQPVVSNEAMATVTANKPSLYIVKTASPSTYSAVGNKITYTYIVQNIGNVGITGPITITDDHLNGGKPFEIQSTGLAVGSQITYNKATYTITQTDFDAGSVTNKASAAGTFNGQPVVSNEAMATVTVEPKALNPSLSLAKSADPSTYSVVGNKITYTYIVQNIGNVGINGPITITDDHLNGGKPFEIQSTGLAVGGQITYNKDTYTISQKDFDAGSVTNKASAAGTFNGQPVVSNEVEATVKKTGSTNVPEFPTITLPVASIIGLMLILGRKKNNKL